MPNAKGNSSNSSNTSSNVSTQTGGRGQGNAGGWPSTTGNVSRSDRYKSAQKSVK